VRLPGVLAFCAVVPEAATPAYAALPWSMTSPRGTGEPRAIIRGSDGALWTRT
jgi:hypothetical protein